MSSSGKLRHTSFWCLALVLTALPLTWYYWAEIPLLQHSFAQHGVTNLFRLPNSTACIPPPLQPQLAIQHSTAAATPSPDYSSTSKSHFAPAAATPRSTLLLCPSPHQQLRDGTPQFTLANFTAYTYLYNFFQLRSSADETLDQSFNAFTEVSLLQSFEVDAPDLASPLGLRGNQLSESVMQHVITCHWTYDNLLQAQSTGSMREHDGNEWLLRCPHPAHAARYAPIKLQLMFTPATDDEVARVLKATAFTVDLPLCSYTARQRSATMCAPPAGEPLTTTQMTQWIDYHLFLGVEYFVVYDRASHYHEALKPYVEAGVVEWVAWPYVGTKLARLFHYRDQVHALLDCVERSRHFSDWLLAIDPDEYVSFFSNVTLIAPPIVDEQSNVIVDSMWLRWLRSIDTYYYGPTTKQADHIYWNQFRLSSYDYFTQTHPHEELLVDQYQRRRLVNNPTRPKSIVRPAAVKDIGVHDAEIRGGGGKLVMWAGYEQRTPNWWSFPQQSISREQADATPQHQAIRANHYINMITNRTDVLLQPGGAGFGQTYDMEHEFAEDTQMQMVSKELKKWKASSDWPAALQQPRVA